MGSESVQEYHADPVAPVQAQTIEPVQADGISVYYSPELEPISSAIADGTPAGRLERLGMLRFFVPQGWKRVTQEGSVFFAAPDLSAGQVCLFAFFPAEEATGDFAAWFQQTLQGSLGAGVKLIGHPEIIRQIAGNGDELMASTRITENAGGQRMYAYFLAVKHGAQRQAICFMSTSLELAFQHLPTLQVLTRNFAIVGQVTPGNLLDGNLPVIDQPKTAPPASSPTFRPALANPNGNAVEPLSNGLLLNMTTTDVLRKLGDPSSDNRAMGGGMGYGSFGLIFNARGSEIWHCTIEGTGVRLNSGLGVGSTRADVKAVFGSVYPGTYDQYDIQLAYDGEGRITRMKIDPANGKFGPCKKIGLTAPAPPAESAKPAATSTHDVVGTWNGTNVLSTIVLKADGTYTYQGKVVGRYTLAGNTITFTGPMAAWDNGRATVKDDVMEFSWKNAEGFANWFQFVKEQ